MKRLKLILSSVAVIIAVTGAFALRDQQPPCTNLPHYYFDGSHYQPAGQLGIDYLCQAAPNNDTCTFIRENDSFIPCRYGTHISVDQ